MYECEIRNEYMIGNNKFDIDFEVLREIIQMQNILFYGETLLYKHTLHSDYKRLNIHETIIVQLNIVTEGEKA